MTIMKSWPDVRDCPPHPRKSLPDSTLHQHRVCIEASSPRIKNGCLNAGEGGVRCSSSPLYACETWDDPSKICALEK